MTTFYPFVILAKLWGSSGSCRYKDNVGPFERSGAVRTIGGGPATACTCGWALNKPFKSVGPASSIYTSISFSRCCHVSAKSVERFRPGRDRWSCEQTSSFRTETGLISSHLISAELNIVLSP